MDMKRISHTFTYDQSKHCLIKHPGRGANLSQEKVHDQLNFNSPSPILANLNSLNVSVYAFQKEIMSRAEKTCGCQ